MESLITSLDNSIDASPPAAKPVTSKGLTYKSISNLNSSRFTYDFT